MVTHEKFVPSMVRSPASRQLFRPVEPEHSDVDMLSIRGSYFQNETNPILSSRLGSAILYARMIDVEVISDLEVRFLNC